MITLVVPTRNRAHTLCRVTRSYFTQRLVDEVIFVNDGSTDGTSALLERLARGYPELAIRILNNDSRKGAAYSRNLGAAASRNEFILFCDDDEYLEKDYAATLLDKLVRLEAGAISGRRIYLRENETPAEAVQRFGDGLRSGPVFRPSICEYVNGARFTGDLSLPLTNANILTRRSLIRHFPFDERYVAGNGYREESDFQMNLFVNGHRVYMSNDCHSYHLPPSQVRTGGQRTSSVNRIYWSVRHTHYFFNKYYDRYAERMRLRLPRMLALLCFSAFAIYRELLRPPLHGLAMTLNEHRRVATHPTGGGP